MENYGTNEIVNTSLHRTHITSKSVNATKVEIVGD